MDGLYPPTQSPDEFVDWGEFDDEPPPWCEQCDCEFGMGTCIECAIYRDK